MLYMYVCMRVCVCVLPYQCIGASVRSAHDLSGINTTEHSNFFFFFFTDKQKLNEYGTNANLQDNR